MRGWLLHSLAEPSQQSSRSHSRRCPAAAGKGRVWEGQEEPRTEQRTQGELQSPQHEALQQGGQGGCVSQAVRKEGQLTCRHSRSPAPAHPGCAPVGSLGAALCSSSAANPAWTCLLCLLKEDTAGKSSLHYFL